MKGQVGNIGVSVVMAAVFIIVGVLIFTQVYDSTPGINRVIINETLTNITTGDPVGYGTYYSTTVASTPVYVGDAFANGEDNLTLSYLNASGLNWVSMTHQTGAGVILTTSDTFNYTSAGVITANASYNGSVLVTYTQYRGSASVMPYYRNINTVALNASQLLAVSAIVLAAVVILSLLFVLGRRA